MLTFTLSEKLYYFNKGGKHLNYTLFKLYTLYVSRTQKECN